MYTFILFILSLLLVFWIAFRIVNGTELLLKSILNPPLAHQPPTQPFIPNPNTLVQLQPPKQQSINPSTNIPDTLQKEIKVNCPTNNPQSQSSNNNPTHKHHITTKHQHLTQQTTKPQQQYSFDNFNHKLNSKNYNNRSISEYVQNHKPEQQNQTQEHLRNQLQFCQLQIKQLYDIENSLREQIRILKSNQPSQWKKLREKNIQLETTVFQLRQKNKNLEKKNIQLKNDFYSINRKYKTMTTSMSLNKPYTSVYITNQNEKQQSLASSRGSPSTKIFNKFELFIDCRFLNDQDKSFIAKCLKQIIGYPTKTQQIYKFDKIHPQNPHDYIHNVSNIILLVQLLNNKIIAAFTQNSFSSTNQTSNNKAFIIDITKKKLFPCYKNTQSITYSQNELIWGNGAIVINLQQPNKLYSNLCHPNSRYWDGKTSNQQFLGNDKGYQAIKNYQIHQISYI